MGGDHLRLRRLRRAPRRRKLRGGLVGLVEKERVVLDVETGVELDLEGQGLFFGRVDGDDLLGKGLGPEASDGLFDRLARRPVGIRDRIPATRAKADIIAFHGFRMVTGQPVDIVDLHRTISRPRSVGERTAYEPVEHTPSLIDEIMINGHRRG